MKHLEGPKPSGALVSWYPNASLPRLSVSTLYRYRRRHFPLMFLACLQGLSLTCVGIARCERMGA